MRDAADQEKKARTRVKKLRKEQVMREDTDQERTPRARVKKLQEEQASIESEQAAKIQAAFRSYIGRQSLISSSLPEKKKALSSICSDLTMGSDWDHSMHSLESLGGSPKTNMRRMEDVPHQSFVLQSPRKFDLDARESSWTTPATTSETLVQDSFSSIFTEDSIDFPIRAPARKLSRPRVSERDSPMQFPKRSPSPTPKPKVRQFRADTV